MAKILKGIDKVETTAGTVVDLDNISASGSAGGLSSTTLGFTRSEDANFIYYDMGQEVANTADGHSTSASHFMIGAGNEGGGFHTSVDLLSFASAAAVTAHGSTHAGSGVQTESNGSVALHVSGYHSNNPPTSTTSLKDFSDSTVHSTSHGSLSNGCWDGAAMSDGDQMIVAGGYASPNALKRSEIIAFADTSAFNAWGDLIGSGAYYFQGASNGSIGMLAGGTSSGSTALNYYQSLSFSSNEAATQHGSMATARWGQTAVSNATILIVCGAGGAAGGDQDVYQEKYAFDAQSTAVAIGDMHRARRAFGGGSSGTEYILAGGVGSGDAKESTSEKNSFEDNATASDWSSLGANRGWVQGTSGNA